MTSFAMPDANSRPDTLLVEDADWWRQAVVYQIYPRSFADANGDGIGDLQGIISRIDYLADLGIDAVWLSPFYPSQLADGGYDVDDYRDVDPRIGTLDEFDEMVDKLHAKNIKVVVDIVPNHTSDQHVWFKAAIAAGKGSPERDRYIFRDGLGENGELPPADWKSTFGGPGWTQVTEPDGTPGQWYCHYFTREQPDLNWKNREVHEEFLKTLRFWSDRGVDGFRIDVAHGLAKDLPEVLPTEAEMDAMPKDGNHPMWDRDDVQDIYAEWRALFNEYTPARTAVAEAWVHSDRIPLYASQNSLGQAFNFDLLKANFDAAEYKKIITHNLELSSRSGSSTTWVFSNHDVVRHATRYGLPKADNDTDEIMNVPGPEQDWLLSGGATPELDRDAGLQRALAATLFMLALPGSSYLYQGEELGLHEVVEIEPNERQDPTFFRHNGDVIGRDGCRVPLPWTSEGPAYGFSEKVSHLPQPEWFAKVSASEQEGDLESPLNLYKRALHLRRELQTTEHMDWLEDISNDDVLAFVRENGWLVVTNFGSEPVELPAGEVLLSSGPVADGQLPGATTVWMRAAK